MKKNSRFWSIAIVLVLGISFTQLVACNNNGDSGDYKKKAPDSVRTWAIFTTPDQWAASPVGLQPNLHIEFIDRKTKDTTYFDTLDENTAKKTYKRDTSYWLYVFKYQMDTLTNKAIIDSNGNPKIKEYYYLQLPKENIKKDLNNYTP